MYGKKRRKRKVCAFAEYSIYQEHEKNYLKNEENLIKIENKKRKQYMKHIDLNELNEFAKNYDEKKCR